MDSPTSAYEKTQPLEACRSSLCHVRWCFRGSPADVPSSVSTASIGAEKLKARFENIAKASDEENRKRAEEERARRQARDGRERELARRRQEVRTVGVSRRSPR